MHGQVLECCKRSCGIRRRFVTIVSWHGECECFVKTNGRPERYVIHCDHLMAKEVDTICCMHEDGGRHTPSFEDVMHSLGLVIEIGRR